MEPFVKSQTPRRFIFTNKSGEDVKEDLKEDVSEKEAILEEEVKKLKEESSELMDKYKRSLADFENLRNRMNKQVADSKKFGIQSFCKDLLEVADVLNKAVGGVPQEALDSESQYLKDVHEGLKLTESQLLKVFERHGLVQENPLNQKFDPNKHDALFTIPNPGVDPNTVLDVQKIGYILHGRTIRPAMVGVSKH
jgi:molecular chaperone GrpE